MNLLKQLTKRVKKMSDKYKCTRTGEVKTAQQWIEQMGGFDLAINSQAGETFDDAIRASLFEDGLVLV